MTKSELIIRLTKAFPHLSPKQIEQSVNTIFDKMCDTLKDDGRIELRGFGAFSTRKRIPRTARNPKTGEKVTLGERKSIYFRAGKQLRERINTSGA